MIGKASITEPDAEAKALGIYVEAHKITEPRDHWRVTLSYCGEPVAFFRTNTEESVRARAQAAVDAERELSRPSDGSAEWPAALPAQPSEASELRVRLAAAESENGALRAALIATKHEPAAPVEAT